MSRTPRTAVPGMAPKWSFACGPPGGPPMGGPCGENGAGGMYGPSGNAEGAGVQRVVAGQVHLDIARRAPAVLVQVLLHELGQGVAELCLPGHEPLVVGRGEGDAVAVRGENLAAGHHVAFVGRLTLQRRTDLDRFDLPFEDASECRSYHTFETAPETLRQAHVDPRFAAGSDEPSCALSPIGCSMRWLIAALLPVDSRPACGPGRRCSADATAQQRAALARALE